jgi:hypothetical protein
MWKDKLKVSSFLCVYLFLTSPHFHRRRPHHHKLPPPPPPPPPLSILNQLIHMHIMQLDGNKYFVFFKCILFNVMLAVDTFEMRVTQAY